MLKITKINLLQRPIRSALILIFLIVTIAFVSFAVFANASAQKLRYDTYNNIGNMVLVSMHQLKGDKTVEEAKAEILQIDGVLGVDETHGVTIKPLNFELVTLYTGENPYEQIMSEGGEEYFEYMGDAIWLIGSGDIELREEFLRGFAELAEGKKPTSENPGVIVSREFSEHNNMSVGDSIEFDVLTRAMGEWQNSKWKEEVFEAEIIGIFETKEYFEITKDNWDGKYVFDESPYNRILSSIEFAKELDDMGEERTFFHFIIESPDIAHRVVEDIRALNVIGGRFDDEVNIKWEIFNELLPPVLDNFQMSIFWVTISALAVGFTLITIMQVIFNNKNEMGVLLSIGEKKGNILKQKFTEYLILILIATPIAITSAYVAFLGMTSVLQPIYNPTNVGYSAKTGKEDILAKLSPTVDLTAILLIALFVIFILILWISITALQLKRCNVKAFVHSEE